MESTGSPEKRDEPLYLPLGPNQIRILAARKSTQTRKFGSFLLYTVEISPSARVLLSMESLTENKRLPYVALSYVWGNAAEKVPFEITSPGNRQKYTIWITRSLLSALDQLPMHYGSEVLMLWVDQISIDQSSEEEKASQLAMMKSIYECATVVFVWLGDPSYDSDLAFSKIKEAVEALSASPLQRLIHLIYQEGKPYKLDQPSIGREENPGRTRAVNPKDQLHGEIQAKNSDDLPVISTLASDLQKLRKEARDLFELYAKDGPQIWRAIAALLTRPWFRRAWIRQEATALPPRSVWVFSGDGSARWDDILHFNHQAGVLPTDDIDPDFACVEELGHRQYTQSIMAFAEGRKYNATLLRLLVELRGTEATDGRDKLFCALSFASDNMDDNTRLRPDYSLTQEEAFTAFVVWYIGLYHDLDFLGFALPIVRETLRWVPFWSDPYKRPLPFQKTTSIGWNLKPLLYSASGPWITDLEVRAPPPRTPEILGLSGVRIATVKRTTEICLDAAVDAFIDSWSSEVQNLHCELNNIPMHDVVARTLMADAEVRVHEGRLAWIRGASWNPHEASDGEKATSLIGVTDGRVGFFTESDLNDKAGLIGLGPMWLEPGDEIFMIKGGQVLYALRPAQAARSFSAVVMDCTGDAHGFQLWHVGDTCMQFVGECFMLGLMDGEIAEMIGPERKRQRPAALESMDNDLRKIYVF